MTANLAPLLGLHSSLPHASKYATTKQKHVEALHGNNMRRPFDPEDLTQRLMDVMAEREATEIRQRVRSLALESSHPRHLPDLIESDEPSDTNITTTDASSASTESLEQPKGFASARARKAKSLQVGTGFENFTWGQQPTSKIPDLKIDTIGPLHSDTVKSPTSGPASSRGPSHDEAPFAAVRASRRVPANVASLKTPKTESTPTRASPDFRHVPQHAASQFVTTTTPSSMFSDPVAREKSRRASMQVFCETDQSMPSPAQRRRSSLRASQGYWDGIQEPTIFESGAATSEAKKMHRRTMIEPPMRRMSAHEAQMFARRMSAGDLLEARANPRGEVETELPREGSRAGNMRASAGPNHFDLLKEHHVDWTQTDEGSIKKRRPSRLLRKLGLGRRSSRDNGEDAIDFTSEDSPTASRQTLEVPESPLKSPRSPRLKSFWPFRKSSMHPKED